MLTDYERQVLEELEADLERRLAGLSELILGLRLPLASIALAETLLPPGAALPHPLRMILVVALAVTTGALVGDALHSRGQDPAILARARLRVLRRVRRWFRPRHHQVPGRVAW